MPLKMNCINAHGALLRILQRVEVEEVGVTLLDVSFHCYCNYIHYVHSGVFSYCPIVIIMCNNVLKILYNAFQNWKKPLNFEKMQCVGFLSGKMLPGFCLFSILIQFVGLRFCYASASTFSFDYIVYISFYLLF